MRSRGSGGAALYLMRNRVHPARTSYMASCRIIASNPPVECIGAQCAFFLCLLRGGGVSGGCLWYTRHRVQDTQVIRDD